MDGCSTSTEPPISLGLTNHTVDSAKQSIVAAHFRRRSRVNLIGTPDSSVSVSVSHKFNDDDASKGPVERPLEAHPAIFRRM